MKKVRRFLFFSLMVGASILVLAACSKNDNSSKETKDGNQKTTTGEEKESTTKPKTTTSANSEQTTEEVSIVDSSGKIIFPDEKVTKIQIRDGNTGKDYLVTSEGDINKFINELKDIKFSAIEEEKTAGTSYIVALANDKNETLVGLVIQGTRTTFANETKETIYTQDKDLVKMCEEYTK